MQLIEDIWIIINRDNIKESLIKNVNRLKPILSKPKKESTKDMRYLYFLKKDPASNGSTNNLYTWEDK